MTRPEDQPFDGRTMPSPTDPWATVDRPSSTVHLHGPTAYLGGPASYPDDRTSHLGGPASYPDDRTSHPGDPGRTVDFGTSAVPEDAAPTVRARGEMRFGPGVPAVPAPPVAAPVWPGSPSPRRRSPLWRRLVSLASTLVTVALVAVVGFYLWQRLSPLAVEDVTVAVPRPAGDRCDVTVAVVATVRTNGRSGVIRYQWLRSGAPPGPVLTEQVAGSQRTATITLAWTFSGAGTTTETATLNIIDPVPVQAATEVAYRCRG